MSPTRQDATLNTLEHMPVQVLRLVLKCKPFQVMRTGEKTEEFRDNTAYWRRRMQDPSTGGWRNFDHVEFSLGYHTDRQQFRAQFRGITIVNLIDRKYRRMLKLHYTFKRRGYIKVWLGDVY